MANSGSASNLVQAARTLSLEWETTKNYWRDLKAQEFERKYLVDLPAQISSTLNAMEEVDALLKRIRSECE